MRRRILVTGASRGIGKHIALALAQDGYDIIVHYNAQSDAALAVANSVRDIGVSAQLLQFDISDRDGVAKTLKEDMEANGSYYGVICNAGIHSDSAFPAMEADAWDRVIRTNLDGFYNVLHPVVMPMVREKQGGRIVVMSSISGITGNRGQVNYSAAKGGLIAAAKALAVELAKRRITVNCVAPGLIETDMTEELDAEMIKSMVPARRLGQPEEVACLVAYLVSPEAEYITRQVISINGGMI